MEGSNGDPVAKKVRPIRFSLHATDATLPAGFMFNLGLRRYPPTEVILSIAAGDEPQRTTALDYFLDNYRRNYADYAATTYANIAFVPAIHRSEKRLVNPLEVFSNVDWQSLGVPVLDPALRPDAVNVLQIKEHPPTDQLVRLLEASPPTTEAQACKWFGILSRRISGLCDAQYDERVC